MTKSVFSNDFENNYHFMYCIKNWNNYLKYVEINCDPASIEIAYEWRNELMKDFYRYAKEWLKNNKNSTFWRKDLR